MLRYILVVVILLTSVSEGQPKTETTAKNLVGSWKLLSYEDQEVSGSTVYPYGKSPAGLLFYDSTGHMAAQIMKNPPPDIASEDWDKFTVPEKVSLYDGYVVYFGRFEVDAARQVVYHLPEADLSRFYIRRHEKRHFKLAGDRPILSETWTQSGKKWSGVRIWQRLK